MKIFKTILWTTFFWLIVVVGLRVASFFFPREATTLIPEKIKSVIIEDANIQCDLENEDQEPLIQENETLQEGSIDNNIDTTELQEQNEESLTSNSLLLPVNESSHTDIEILENRITNLENEHSALVLELKQIFSIPALAEILSQAEGTTSE